MTRPQRDESENGSSDARRDWLVLVFLAEAAALMIALVTPVTPSKTGSTWSPAELIWPDPSYLQEVAISFLMVNALIVLLGLVAWLGMRIQSGKE